MGPEDEGHPSFRSEDLRYMQRALDLAIRAEGRTAPNPMVGAVIVRDGRVLGEGWHRRAGGPHAEIEALRAADAAGEDVRGAVMYVSLEPCCHHGKTPPCTAALIEAGIGIVYYAVPDENPRVAGGGHRQLVEAGIHVVCGPLETEARFLNRAFFHFISKRRPWVIAKYAMSLDGRIATHTGSSQWISGAEALTEAHRLRDRCDGILVGAGTALADDPRLTVRLPDTPVAHPTRILLDSRGRVPLGANLFDPDLPGATWVATTEAMDPAHRAALTARGVVVILCETDGSGRVRLVHLLEALARRGVVTLMVEGGSAVVGSFFSQGLIQETWVVVGGKLIGGTAAPGPIGGVGVALIGDAPAVDLFEGRPVGGDFLLRALVRPPKLSTKNTKKHEK
ncbi:bifunctional diaminohydroxyphosphoribosylaminopyrimidine deaminase/5-amino-6-(5-phosphoribosylamino)uracil reductase RibD [Sulfidibacter corallicola]|uniref:Riboflavin biosynthesis protein RibD n=1 Tax=Sulfidibacter corallicola TaxID=2818388 RepID=A0A8A4TG50_SULCO|nr:bifunctional diaminohydroxyphosphoribosylaminopyrimidine deaminase/5-amino-6-(5-phosphoribosylamino)uracil reductase RibD [Sulfidibacter corallicola]QTD48162.1 bifunctional diaminohydroxyphosphoribosylaminopyrimidine deaminase/5-amino-6-(5-phosphoribosylamino)uracil reductase RibD [Sulfidibacter corallicola]